MFASGLYDAAYTNTLSTQQAAYIAGATPPGGLPTYATFQSDLAVSESGSAATADATEYARRLALRDAILAGRDAARSGSIWITIGAYGTGAAPIFNGGATASIGIDLSGPAKEYAGGWKIQDIEIENYLWRGIRAFTGVTSQRRGLWITSTVSVHNITGTAFSTTFPYTYDVVPGSHFFTPVGVETDGTRNVDFAGTYDSSDTPFHLENCSDTVIDGANAHHSNYLHPYLDGGGKHVWQNSIYDSMCDGPGLLTGSAGAVLGGNVDVVLYNLEIKNTPKQHQDGAGIDFEVQVTNGTLLACNIHDNADAALEILADPSIASGSMLVKNTLANNAIGYPASGAGNVLFTNVTTPNTSDRVLCVANDVTKAVSPAQPFLFSMRNSTLSNTITDVFANGIFGPDNTVH